MPADYSRIHRLLRILTLIQGRGDWSAKRLAEECGVTVRTIYRDMKDLEGAGIPYFHDRESQGYRVRRDFFMPPVDLKLDECLALVALGEHVADRDQIPLAAPAGRAIAKVRSQLPPSLQAELDQLDDHITIDLAAAGSSDSISDPYERVRAAIVSRRRLSCSYESISRSLETSDSDDERAKTETFDFEPYALFFAQRAWYAVGHHHGRNEIRKLKLSRFTSIQPTHRQYDVPANWDLKSELGHAWRMIRGDERHDVELHFDARFAETIADTHWHPTQQIDWHDDGSITFRCTVDGLDEIVWWILSMGPHCVVRQPSELANRVRDLAMNVVRKYDHLQIRATQTRLGGTRP